MSDLFSGSAINGSARAATPALEAVELTHATN